MKLVSKGRCGDALSTIRGDALDRDGFEPELIALGDGSDDKNALLTISESERGPTASGSQTRRIFFPTSMTCEERPSYDISIHVLKYALATLIQGVASALRHQLLEHTSHGFYSIHQMIQLRKLSLGERSPAFRSASDVAETKEQASDFSQCKTELTRTLNDCQAVKRRGVISSLPAHSRGPGKQSNSLVVPNRRCLESNLSRHLGNR
jgi:hypothetical protein